MLAVWHGPDYCNTLKPKQLKCQNRIILSAKIKTPPPRHKQTVPALPKIFFLHLGNSSVWELQKLSQHISKQVVAGGPETVSPPKHVPTSTSKQHIPCQMGWEPMLSSHISLAPAHPPQKQSKSKTFASARPIYTLKHTGCLSVSSYSCGGLWVHQNKITAGVRLG